MTKFGELLFKRYIQKYTVSNTNTHHDMTDLMRLLEIQKLEYPENGT